MDENVDTDVHMGMPVSSEAIGAAPRDWCKMRTKKSRCLVQRKPERRVAMIQQNAVGSVVTAVNHKALSVPHQPFPSYPNTVHSAASS